VVLLKRGFGRQTTDKPPVALLAKKNIEVIPQQAIKAIRVLSTRKMVLRRQKLGWHFLLFTTALGLYGGVLWLWSGEFQGFILHEVLPVVASSSSCFLLAS
jgi:hypothetical protein